MLRLDEIEIRRKLESEVVRLARLWAKPNPNENAREKKAVLLRGAVDRLNAHIKVHGEEL